MFFFHDGLLKYFSNKQSYKVLIESSFNITVNIHISKSIHYDVVIKNDEDWKHQEKKS